MQIRETMVLATSVLRNAEARANGARRRITVACNVMCFHCRARDGRGFRNAKIEAAPVIDRGRQVRIDHAALLSSAPSTLTVAGSSNSSPQSAQTPWRGSSSYASMDRCKQTSSPSSLADGGGDVGFGSSMTL